MRNSRISRSILFTKSVILIPSWRAWRIMASVLTIIYVSHSVWNDNRSCVRQTPSTTSTTSKIPSASRIADATSSTKFTCPGVSMKCTKCDLPPVVDKTNDIGDDLIDISRSRDRTCVSVYFNWRSRSVSYSHSSKLTHKPGYPRPTRVCAFRKPTYP